MFFAYVLQSEITSTYYYGFTQNIEKRVAAHNAGLVRYTSKFLPWKLVYYETCKDRATALKREKYFKTGAGRDFIKRQLAA